MSGPTGRWEGIGGSGKTWSPQVGGVVFPNPHMLSTWGIPRGDITLWVWGEAKMPSCPQVGGGGTSEPVLSNDGFGGWENLEPTGRWGGRSESPCTVDMGHTQMCLYHLDMRNLKMPSCLFIPMTGSEVAASPQVGGGPTYRGGPESTIVMSKLEERLKRPKKTTRRWNGPPGRRCLVPQWGLLRMEKG